jgi:hypothetical protein
MIVFSGTPSELAAAGACQPGVDIWTAAARPERSGHEHHENQVCLVNVGWDVYATVGATLGVRDMPWFNTQEEAREFVMRTAREVVSGERDAYDGGADIWHTAALLHDEVEWPELLPFAELTDALERQDLTRDEIERGKAALREAARRILVLHGTSK